MIRIAATAGVPTWRTSQVVTLVVHVSKAGQVSSQLPYDSPVLAVAKGRAFNKTGWQVHITDVSGREYHPEEFDKLLHCSFWIGRTRKYSQPLRDPNPKLHS